MSITELASLLGWGGIAYAPLFFIFFDYHKRHNIWKSFVFIGAIVSAVVLNVVLGSILGSNYFLLLPVYAAFPFIVALVGRKRPSDDDNKTAP